MDRVARRILNSKQDSIINNPNISVDRMPEGQINISQKRGEDLSLAVKSGGRVWKTYLNSDGNLNVDKKLTAEELKFTRKFTDYKTFIHNFYDDIHTDEHYLPWDNSTAESTIQVDRQTGYLAPYNMTLHKIVVRFKIISGSIDTNANIVFKLGKIDSGDSTEDSVSTATYNPSTLAELTPFTINRTDFNNSTKIEAGDVAFMTIDASADIAGGVDWWITSVWETEITI